MGRRAGLGAGSVIAGVALACVVMAGLLAVYSASDDGAASTTTSANPPMPAPAYDRSADPVARQFDRRTRYADCGAVAFEQGPYPGLPDGPLLCMRRARSAGTTAELKVTRPATEGDPISTYLRLLSDGRVEQYIDNTADTYGSPGWTRTVSACVDDHETLGQICRAA